MKTKQNRRGRQHIGLLPIKGKTHFSGHPFDPEAGMCLHHWTATCTEMHRKKNVDT